MFGLPGGLDPKKMQAMMRQLGMNQEEIDASRVIIEKNDGNKLVIENPSVTKISIKGEDSFQISGSVSEQSTISATDISTIMEKTGCTEKEARATLESAGGDLAEAILSLS